MKVSEPTRRRHKLAQARSYDADFHAWADAQTSTLRHLQPRDLDWRNLIEEIMAAARSEERALGSQLERLLIHLLKWRYESARCSGSWQATIMNSRDEIDELLKRSPSLQSDLDEVFRTAYRRARREAGAQMGLDKRGWEQRMPAQCEWRLEQVRDPDFWPD